MSVERMLPLSYSVESLQTARLQILPEGGIPGKSQCVISYQVRKHGWLCHSSPPLLDEGALSSYMSTYGRFFGGAWQIDVELYRVSAGEK